MTCLVFLLHECPLFTFQPFKLSYRDVKATEADCEPVHRSGRQRSLSFPFVETAGYQCLRRDLGLEVGL